MPPEISPLPADVSAKWGGILHVTLERVVQLEAENRQLVNVNTSNEEKIERLRKEMSKVKQELFATQGKQAIDGESNE